MNLGSRLDRLENRADGPRGRCPVCIDREGGVIVRNGELEGDASACPSCFWSPFVIEVLYSGSMNEGPRIGQPAPTSAHGIVW